VVVCVFTNSSANAKGEIEYAVGIREVLPLSFTDEQKYRNFSATKSTAVYLHASYSPKLAPCTLFFFFPSMKMRLRGLVPRLFLKFRNNLLPSCAQFQISIPAVLPAVARNLDPLLDFIIGLPGRERQPMRRVDLHFSLTQFGAC
jgi:hypothetical protein